MRDRRKLLSVLALVASLWIVPSAHGQTFDFKQKLVPPGGELSAEFGIAVAIDGAVAVVGAPEDTVSTPGGEGSARVFVNVAGTWTLAQTLANAGGSFADEFGRSVAISGNTIVVGAPGVTVQTGVPGQGAAYVFVWNGATWAQQARLVAADGGGGEHFGTSVSIDGNTVIVAAASADLPSAVNAGEAWVFERTGITWAGQKLVAPDGATNDFFGRSVDVSGGTVCIGSAQDDSSRGSIYMFTRGASAWGFQQKLTAPGTVGTDIFGSSCAIHGDTVVSGALSEDEGGEINQGAVYVFVRSGSVWGFQQRLGPSDGGANKGLGSSVAIHGNRIAAGAPGDDVGLRDSGAVYMYDRTGTVWTERQKIKAGDAAVDDDFGSAVSMDAFSILIGAPHPFPSNSTGFAYVFGFPGGPPTGIPGVPQDFQAIASGNTVNMSWSAPASGAAPTGYTLVARTTGGQMLATVPLGNVTSMSAAAPNGVYALSVLASNASGPGPESARVAVTVPAATPPPGNPTNLVVNVAGNAATFTWNAPASGGPATGYLLAAGTSPSFAVPLAVVPLPATPRSVSVTGIPTGRFYVRILAQNAGGASGASNEVTLSVAGALAPGAPTLNAPTVSGTTVGLSWSPGGGGTPSSYVIAAASAPGGAPFATASVTGTSITIPGVPRGTYFLRLVAVNAAGSSPASHEVTLVVP